MRYPVLFFDADHTLFDFDRGQEWAIKQTFLDECGTFEPSWFDQYIEVNHRLWASLDRGEITLENLKESRFREFSAAVGVAFDPDKFNQTYLSRLGECTFLLDGADTIINTLATANHKLIMVTNGLAEVQKPRFAASELTQHFHGTVISGEIGVAKPAAGIFDVAMDKAGVHTKENILMIGDNLKSDIKGGIDYGIDTCWFNPQQLTNESDVKPTHEIVSLDQLLELVA